jgi:hypothetical protein
MNRVAALELRPGRSPAVAPQGVEKRLVRIECS